MNHKKSTITTYLENSPQYILVIYAIGVSFCTYFCMYAFRKPFVAGSYSGIEFLGIAHLNLKTVLVISQIVGYTLSKYIGIKLCSEVSQKYRAWALVFLIAIAEVALLLFAILPNNLKIVAIFLNGLPLGMVWGLVVWYLEGRRTSELLLAGLSCSFIVSSGMVKDFGLLLMLQYGISEFWMPFVAGLFFFPFFALFVWLLNQIPQPSLDDENLRVKREPMDSRKRRAFTQEFFFGLLILFTAYFFLTAYRDIRDNYGVEILKDLGYGSDLAKGLFSRIEWPVAFGVMAAMGALFLIKDNRKGLIWTYVIMAGGTFLMGFSTLLFDLGYLSGLWWMTLVGLGSYLTYVPYGSVLFDRTIATTKVTGTAVFAIYIADAIGYTGSIAVQLFKEFSDMTSLKIVSWLGFFRSYTYFMSILGTLFLVWSCAYFLQKARRTQNENEERDGIFSFPYVRILFSFKRQ